MLRWNDLHPYNAVHVTQISEALDLNRLRLAIHATLESQGLTNLHLNRDRGTYLYHGGPAECEIRIIPKDGPSLGSLQAEIEHQINTRFVQGERLNPFRFFVDAHEHSFALGLVYFHPVADAEAIVHLMMHIVDRFAGRAGRQPEDSPNLHPRRHDQVFRQPPGLLVRKLAALPSTFRDMRRSSRPRYRDPEDFHNGFLFFPLPSVSVRLLMDASKTLGVTLHDLFLALLMNALSPLAADRLRSRRRKKISLGSIVNLRKDLGSEYAEAFGLYLGSFVVTHEVPEHLSVKALAGDIRQQTLRIKRHKLYLGTPLELVLGRLALSLFSTEQGKKFYQKHYPLWGGITNMNLNRLGKQKDGAGMNGYFRAVSTGPVTPLVLSITTAGDAANIGVTYRSTAFGAAEIAQVRERLLEGIDSLASRV